MRAVPTIVTVSLNPAIDRVIEVPDFKPGAHQVGREVSRIAGGKAVNVSRVLAALGVPNIATGFLGQENRADFEQILKGPLVKDELFLLPGRTRENVTIADPTTGRETHIRDLGLEVPAPALGRLVSKLKLLCSRRPVVIFGGSRPPGISVEVFAELVSNCISAGARVAVDASGEGLAAMAGKPLWLVKPNADELAQLVGRELPTEQKRFQAARELAKRNLFIPRYWASLSTFRVPLTLVSS